MVEYSVPKAREVCGGGGNALGNALRSVGYYNHDFTTFNAFENYYNILGESPCLFKEW